MPTEILHTPAERRRLKVREMILSAAERVFAREGAEGLSIRRLAQAIDYSPAAIYKYFGSKDELVDELKESFFELLLIDVHEIFDSAKPFAQRARACVGTYVEIAADKPHHYSAAFTGQAVQNGIDVDDPEFENSMKGKAFMVLKSMIEEGVENGTFRKEIDPTLSAKSVWASMHGLAMMMAHMPTFPAFKPNTNTLSRAEFIEFHADQIVRGMEA
ncbi:MAG: helix-turn-helix domain containing protein [Henriciella sp.]|nr:helix-turn-helix domain containing protein [Henriciella sp.]